MAVEVRHGDQVQVVQDAVHTDTDVNVKERFAAMLAVVKRYRKCPHVVVGQDVADDLQGVADQDSHVLIDDCVVEAAELDNLASVSPNLAILQMFLVYLIVVATCRNDKPHDTCWMASLKRMTLLVLTM